MRLSPGWMTFLIGLMILAVAGVFYQQSLVSSGALGTGSSGAASTSTYTCPMHPQVVQDEPGTCPICGMELVLKDMGGAGTASSGTSMETGNLYTCPMHPQVVQEGPGTCPICGMELVRKKSETAVVDPETGEAVKAVKISPLQSVLANINPVHPEWRSIDETVRAIGEAKVPEDRINMLVSWQKGRVDSLKVRETGVYVRKGQHLLDIYSEELVQAQEEHLLAVRARDNLGESSVESVARGARRMIEASRRKLKRLGLSEELIGQLEADSMVVDSYPIFAKHSGIVMKKMVNEGVYVMEGGPLFEVAALDPIWVDLSVFEHDASNVSAGHEVELDCPVHPGMVFRGTVDLIEPTLDVRSRTIVLRVEVDNRSEIIRPGMVLNAKLEVSRGNVLVLPRNAVLHTGDGDLVYTLAGENLWKPRRVEVGRDFGDVVEILSGISESDAVAGTAVFLLDSEAQLKGIPRPIDSSADSQPAQQGGGHVH